MQWVCWDTQSVKLHELFFSLGTEWMERRSEGRFPCIPSLQAPSHLMSIFELPSTVLWRLLDLGWALLFVCLSSHLKFMHLAHLGLYVAGRTERSVGIAFICCFAFVNDFSWKTQKYRGKPAKIVLPTFWNFKETHTHTIQSRQHRLHYSWLIGI